MLTVTPNCNSEQKPQLQCFIFIYSDVLTAPLGGENTVEPLRIVFVCVRINCFTCFEKERKKFLNTFVFILQ